MPIIKKKWFLIVSLSLILGCIFSYVQVGRKGDSAQAMESLILGSSYNELIQIAGKPDYLTDGTEGPERNFRKSKNQLISGCVKEAWYQSPLKLPSKFSFCFDADGKLLYKYHWSSW